MDIQFIKDFAEVAKQQELPECRVLFVGPSTSVKRGTRHLPSPFFDRKINVKNDRDRYLLHALREYTFLYGDKYENYVGPDHEYTNRCAPRQYPDPDLQCVSVGSSSTLVTLDLVHPNKVGNTVYFMRNKHEDGTNTYDVIRNTDTDLKESIKTWMPSKRESIIDTQAFMRVPVEGILQLSIGDQVFVNPDNSHMLTSVRAFLEEQQQNGSNVIDNEEYKLILS